MAENVIFTPRTSTSPSVKDTAEGVSAMKKTPPASPLPPPPALPVNEEYEDEYEEEPSRLGMILKIGGGIVLFLVLIFLFVRFVLPLFGGKKGDVTLTYWGLWEDSPVMERVISDFEKQNPRIKVTYVKQDIKQYRERLTTRIGNGSGPDIFRLHNTWLPMFSSVLSPLPQSVITTSDFQKLYPPVVQTDVVRQGAIYGLPLSIDTLTLFTNDDILKAVGASSPKDWNEFISVTRSLRVPPSGDPLKTAGAGIGTYDNVTHAPDILSLLMAQNSTKFQDFNSTLDNASQAVEFYTNFAQGDEKIWDSDQDNSLTAFAKGNVGMYFGYSWDIFTIKAMNKDLAFSTHPVPTLPGGSPLTIASYWVEGVSNKSKNQQEALLLLKFLTQKDTLQKLYTEEAKTREFGEIYARSDLSSTLKTNTLLAPFIDQIPHAVSSYFIGNTFDNGINEHMNAYLGNAVRAVLNGTSAQSATETLGKGVSQMQSQYGQ